MKGLLVDGPAAGSVVEAGDPPVRRGVIVTAPDGFAEDAYRYYLTSVDAGGALYTYADKVAWPPEAGSQMVGRLSDRREPAADQPPPGAGLNGD